MTTRAVGHISLGLRRQRRSPRSSLAGVGVTLRPATTSYTNGNLTAATDDVSFAYDTADRTTSITPAGGAAATFVYRGAGQSERSGMSPASRVSAACTAIAGCAPATSTLGSASTFEHSTLGVAAETIDGATTYYVRDPRGGLLAQRSPSGTHYYRFDGQGSITGLLDTGGSLVATYAYDPFGQLTSMTGGTIATNNPWRYVGAFQDGTGLYKMGHRYYDPSLGRWTQQDPIHDPLDPKQWNRYVYVGNDPINYRDPTGLAGCRTGGLFEFFDRAFDFIGDAVFSGGVLWGGWRLLPLLLAPSPLVGTIALLGSVASFAIGGYLLYRTVRSYVSLKNC